MTSGKHRSATGGFATPTRRVINSLFLCIAAVGALGAAPALRAENGDEDPRQIVERTDRIRFPAASFQVDVTINNSDADGTSESRKFRILSKGNEDTLVITTEPPTERGHILLLKGRDLWAFMPSVSQPIRLPLAQRLTGQVANGDLARANFAGDYHPKILRKEIIDGAWYWVLELTAVDRGVTYDRVLYWVNQTDNRPYKAEFYTRSNRLMKTCFYQNFALMQGEQRPTRLVMIDNLNQGNKSTLDYSDMTLKDLPDKMFTKDYLKKLQ